MRRRYLIIGAIVALVCAGLFAYSRTARGESVTYATTRARHEDLSQTVTATGTVNAQNTVAVGTQVSGTVAEVFVDFNSHVKRGQVLAKLDPTTFQAAVAQAEANLRQVEAQARSARSTAGGARSSIGSAEATGRAAGETATAAAATAKSAAAAVANARAQVAQTAAALALAERTLARDRQLLAQGYIAQNQFDTDNSSYIAAQSAAQNARTAVTQAELGANASTAQAAASRAQAAGQFYGVASARAQADTQAAAADAAAASVTSAQAQVRSARVNLDRTIITSPVDGTVVARDVSVGTTVAASLQTPTLFSIAQNLRKMEVDLAVGEPDIGNVKPGKAVNFTVLAYPDRTFHGTVKQVRINPVTTNNVVTYTTTVLVDNADGTLLPGMTANANVEVARAADADVVPLAALSYAPPRGAGRRARGRAPEASPAPGASPGASPDAGSGTGGARGAWGKTRDDAGAAPTAGARGRVFVLEDGKLVRVPVKILLIGGTSAAVETTGEQDLDPLSEVVVSDSSKNVAGPKAATAGNPLLGGPQGGRGGRGGGRGGRL